MLKLAAQQRSGPALRHIGAAVVAVTACLAPTHVVASACTNETLSSVLLSQSVPVELFANPNGNPLTSGEIDEIRASTITIRSTLGTVASMVSVGSPHVPRSLDITVGANARATGYSFSPKAYAAQTAKAGQVVITFGTDTRSETCRIFWVRVSIPAGDSKIADRDVGRGV